MLQIYTGNGKGKTTAAIGLSIRAIGAGMNVYFAQFMKSLAYSEQKILQKLPGITLKTSGKPYFIAEEGMVDKEKIKKEWGEDIVVFPKNNPPADYIKLVRNGIDEVKKAVLSSKYNLIILDEINVALFFGLVNQAEVEQLLNSIPHNIEVVCTGRNAPDWLIQRADLVTEMKLVKHYFDKGIMGRKGIED
ncbi:cob(I)yrinic acid a,c-diamide adenosyltransferase [Pectinatus sottacetonis]|uniref:cob(I)yrinic acid a,c-diamide adenosyltransferase n=1 Tax=Pectinatus sottacetonis TaxID=1002795 RepID=UPI0018C798AF|nr:cob(I)yrinic acid a,c-diamide adenosyltransferase [Pectinatus sottacetonis]